MAKKEKKAGKLVFNDQQKRTADISAKKKRTKPTL
jgi:hypothetical protein